MKCNLVQFNSNPHQHTWIKINTCACKQSLTSFSTPSKCWRRLDLWLIVFNCCHDRKSAVLVFHVSQLKQSCSCSLIRWPSLHQLLAVFRYLSVFSSAELLFRETSTVLQVLVKWSGLHPSLAAWEDYEALHQQFPRYLLGGEQVLNGSRCYSRYRRPGARY
jgi:predicted amidophosphoribosyltransferase